MKPDIVIIAIGTNDIFGNLGISLNSTPEFYQTVMTRVFDKLKLNLPDTPVFVTGMTTVLRKYAHMKFGNFLPPQKDLQTIFNEYNNILEELAQDFNLFYVDLPSQWPEDVEESWQFYADGIHPNDTGYDLMAKILYDALRSTVIHHKQEN